MDKDGSRGAAGEAGVEGLTKAEGAAESLARTEESKEPLGMMSLTRGVWVGGWVSV